ncbi:MAG: DUF192 domain-containing protein [Elusimicrobiota bacterium]
MVIRTLQINGLTTNVPVVIANSIIKRTLGLMGEKNGDYALLIPHCPSVHTWFMRYAIDVICLNEDYRVMRTIAGCKPWRIILPSKGTRHILEIPSGHFHGHLIQKGDILNFN